MVPLLLTFYCLLAGDGEIPRRRRELYTRLVDQLLSASWVDDQPHVPDRKYCQRLLAGWAWRAVADAVTPTGLGNWPDRSSQPTDRARTRAGRSHVAHRTGVDTEGNTTRRFVHRTLLEHFVAEKVAAMDTNDGSGSADAATCDSTPTGNSRHRPRSVPTPTAVNSWSCLLQPAFSSPDRAKTPVGRETDRLLLRIGAESLPADWDQTCASPDPRSRGSDGATEEPSLARSHQPVGRLQRRGADRVAGRAARRTTRPPSARLVGAVVALGSVRGTAGTGADRVTGRAARRTTVRRGPPGGGGGVPGSVAGTAR